MSQLPQSNQPSEMPLDAASETAADLLSGLTRRRFLQGTALAGFGAFLAACAGGGASQTPAGSVFVPTAPPIATPTGAPTPKPTPTGPLQFANWPAYIDLTGKAADEEKYSKGSSPTIQQFQDKYKVEVNYVEKIEANEDFYALIQPQLQAGLPTGWDLIVVTDWLAAKIIAKSWAEAIDKGDVPNAVNNLEDALKNYPWDANNDYHYPWQSGMTGIGYNTKTLAAVKKPEPKSLADLYALPANKITFLNEKRDTFGLGLLKLGINPDPATVTADNLQAVHDDMKPLVEGGLRFTGNEYLADFSAKKVYAAMVWSGDLASSGTEGDTFAFPTEGCMVWTDNMVIPKGAQNKYTAELMINFVYDPKIAAQIENYVYYVCPVKGAKDIMQELNKDAPLDQYYLDLVFPGPNITAKFHNFESLSDDIETKMNDLYADLAGA
jgi:spermidine/putrescine transport system substrate-binding protein